jgi:hypothetical protein
MIDKYTEATERVTKDVGDDITEDFLLSAWQCITYSTLWPIPTSPNRSLLAMVKEELND